MFSNSEYSNGSSYRPLDLLRLDEEMENSDGDVTLRLNSGRTSQATAASSGCLGCFRSALGRVLGRQRHATPSEVAFQYLPRLIESMPPPASNQYQPIPMRELQPPAPPPALDDRNHFLTLKPNPTQLRHFDQLLARHQSAPNPATALRWLQALADLSQRVIRSNSLEEQVSNERRDLLDSEPLRRMRESTHLAPHEQIQLRCIQTFIKIATELQSGAVAGNASTLALLQWARHCLTDLDHDHEPATATTEASLRELEELVAEADLGVMSSQEWARTGQFLQQVEGLKDRSDVMDALRFMATCKQRVPSILGAVMAARVRERLLQEGVALEKAESAAMLLQPAGTASLDDLMTVARTLTTMAPAQLAPLLKTPLVIHVCNHDITDWRSFLKGRLTPLCPQDDCGDLFSESADALQRSDTPAWTYWDDWKVVASLQRCKHPVVVVALAPPGETADHAAPSLIPEGFDTALAKARQWAMDVQSEASGANAGSAQG